VNGIIEDATGDLLRAGFGTFTPGVGESLRTDVPEPPLRRENTVSAQMHRWNGASWILVANIPGSREIKNQSATKQVLVTEDVTTLEFGKIFGKTDGKVYFLNSFGTEYDLTIFGSGDDPPINPDMIQNAQLSFVSVSSVASGTTGKTSVVRDTTNVRNITWSNKLTATLPTDLDTGTEAADTWYAVHVIDDTTDTNPVKLLLSTSQTAPVLPVGYDVFRRVGWCRNDGSSNIRSFFEYGDSLDRQRFYDVNAANLVVLNNGNDSTFNDIALSSFIPPNAEVAILSADVKNKDLFMRTNGSAEAPILITANRERQFQLKTDAAQVVEYRVAQSSGSATIYCLGYVGRLGI